MLTEDNEVKKMFNKKDSELEAEAKILKEAIDLK